MAVSANNGPSPQPAQRERQGSPVTVVVRHAAIIAMLLTVSIGIQDARSAPQRAEDPDWPCQQRLVPKLTAAAYWSGPQLDSLGDWRADPEVADLVRRLGSRRVTTEEGVAEIAAFTRTESQDGPRRLALVFRGLLEETDQERDALIARLKEIGRHQRELADLVAKLQTELNSISPDAEGEAAARRVDLQQRHDFTVRNFEEIQRTIRYACETPVALDARLGAWARALQSAVPNKG